MVPWPIALLCAAYTMLATSSVATMWRALHQSSVGSAALHQSWWWPALWRGVSVILVMGLAWLKPWARRLAIWTSGLMMLGSLGVAGVAIVQTPPAPMRSLLATGMAGVQLLVIRYLTRPHVKHWFEPSVAQGSRLEAEGQTLEP